jgi:LDH2 family malate/lactate/ureidoglycolate dehydrogenase
MPDHDRIYTAGEKEYLTWQERKKTGIPLNKSLQRELVQLRDDCGLEGNRFPF